MYQDVVVEKNRESNMDRKYMKQGCSEKYRRGNEPDENAKKSKKSWVRHIPREGFFQPQIMDGENRRKKRKRKIRVGMFIDIKEGKLYHR